MVRCFSFAAFVVLISLSWLVFELTNVWPFNADKIVLLRTFFVFFALSATGAFLFARWRLLPAFLLVAAFATTTAVSNAVINLPSFASMGVLILLVAIVSRLFGHPLNVG